MTFGARERRLTRDTCLPRDRVRLATRIRARDATTRRRHQNHLRATELLTRLQHLHLMPALDERIANVSRDAWLDAEPFASIPAEPRRFHRLLRR